MKQKVSANGARDGIPQSVEWQGVVPPDQPLTPSPRGAPVQWTLPRRNQPILSSCHLKSTGGLGELRDIASFDPRFCATGQLKDVNIIHSCVFYRNLKIMKSFKIPFTLHITLLLDF